MQIACPASSSIIAYEIVVVSAAMILSGIDVIGTGRLSTIWYIYHFSLPAISLHSFFNRMLHSSNDSLVTAIVAAYQADPTQVFKVKFDHTVINVTINVVAEDNTESEG
jgi:hypothetical protein